MLFNVSAAESYPVIERYTAASSTEFHAYYAKIYSVTFLNAIDWNDINSADQYWDSSAADDGSVISYIKYNESQSTAAGADRYDLYMLFSENPHSQKPHHQMKDDRSTAICL